MDEEMGGEEGDPWGSERAGIDSVLASLALRIVCCLAVFVKLPVLGRGSGFGVF